MAKIKVLIVDDSAVMRRFLSDALAMSSEIEVVATAIDPYIAANKIKKFQPDVITLDIEMPRMDGLTFLNKLMMANPLPVVMVSSLTDKGAAETVKALQYGAVDFILKRSLKDDAEREEFAAMLAEKIIIASRSKVKRKEPSRLEQHVGLKVEQRHTADVILSRIDPMKVKARSEKLIAIGASTGGTEVIDEILVNIPNTLPGVVITQHMPEKFTDAFAKRVNQKSPLFVKEAVHGDRIYKGMALVAPGGKHMLIHADSNGYWTEIHDGPPVNRHKPSVDVLFRSVSQCAGRSAVGILCTGMGNDGAAGLLEMKHSGAVTIGQNEASCVVYGMPKEAVKLGAVDMEKDIRGIIDYIKGME